LTAEDLRQVRDDAIRLLASREHSRAELRRKLIAKLSDSDALDRLLDDLESGGLQSDQRFVEQYLYARKRKGFGPLRIRQELIQKGLSRELIREWIDEGDPAWEAVMVDVARRKFGSTPPEDFRESARRARFLEYRGFSGDQIRVFLRSDE